MGKLATGKLDLAEIAAKSYDELDDTGKLVKAAIDNRVLTTAGEMSEQVGNPLAKAYRGTIGKVEGKLANINEMVENQSRLSAFITAKAKGATDEAAALMVDKALYSYDPSMLSQFERNFMRRVVPFYVWMRRNTPHMAELLFTKPGAVAWVGHTKESGEAVNPIDNSITPDWLKDAFAVPTPLRDKRGNTLALQTNGWFPTGDLDIITKVLANPKSVPAEVLSQASPLIKTPIEIITNHDIYYNDQIESFPGETRRAPAYVEVFDDLTSGTPFGALWQGVKDKLGWFEREDSVTGEPYLAIPAKTVKFLKDLNPWMNAVGKTIADTPTQSYDKLSYMTGTKITPFDTERFTRQQAYDDQAALQAALRLARDQGKIPEKQKKTKTTSLKDILGR
jgi:hypothetical protein